MIQKYLFGEERARKGMTYRCKSGQGSLLTKMNKSIRWVHLKTNENPRRCSLATITQYSGASLWMLMAVARLKDEAYAAEIQRLLNSVGYTVAYGSLITALHRLEAARVVKSFMTDPEPVRGGRAKRVYQLTPLGVNYLQRFDTSYAAMRAGLETLLDTNKKK